MAGIDPELRYLLEKHEGNLTAGAPTDEPDGQIQVMVYYSGDIQSVVDLGFTVDSYHYGMAAGHLLLANLKAIASLPNVDRIVKTRSYYPTLDDSIPEIRANTVRTVDTNTGACTGFAGTRIVVGIIDTGIDYRHNAFRANGTSRILRIWDQSVPFDTETATGKQKPTVPAGIVNPKGVEYTQKSINTALTSSNPLSVVGQMDVDGHGTHVAGIAAGNGGQAGGCHGKYHYIGVAPDADLIIVKLDHFGKLPGDKKGGASEPDILNAIEYIVHHAKHPELRDPKPADVSPQRVVVNLSLGAQYGSHDGQVAQDLNISALQLNNTNTLVTVIAAGNEGADSLHAQADVPASGFLELEVDVKTNSKELQHTESIEIWFGRAHTLTCAVQPNDGAYTVNVDKNSAQTFAGINHGGDVRIDSQSVLSSSTDENFYVQFVPPATGGNKTGIWKIKLTNPNPAPVPIHAWVNSNSTTGSKFKTAVSSHCTVATPGTAEEAITVASYRLGTFLGMNDGKTSNFSSAGPTRDDLFTKPDLAAPGEAITAPGIASDRNDVEDYLCFNCCCDCCADFYVDKQGTSMAAPHVTGAVALLLQKDPSLTHKQVRNLLIANVRIDADTGSIFPNPDYGYGKMDVAAAVNSIFFAPPVAPVPTPAPTPMVAIPRIDLQQRFLHTSRGTELHNAFRDFAREVLRLINTNKRVATVWHRIGGPAWVRVAFQAAATPTMPIPDQINGLSFFDGIDRMLAILKQYGSDPFVQLLNQYEPELAHVQPGMSLYQLIDRFNEPALIT